MECSPHRRGFWGLREMIYLEYRAQSEEHSGAGDQSDYYCKFWDLGSVSSWDGGAWTRGGGCLAPIGVGLGYSCFSPESASGRLLVIWLQGAGIRGQEVEAGICVTAFCHPFPNCRCWEARKEPFPDSFATRALAKIERFQQILIWSLTMTPGEGDPQDILLTSTLSNTLVRGISEFWKAVSWSFSAGWWWQGRHPHWKELPARMVEMATNSSYCICSTLPLFPGGVWFSTSCI